MNKAACHTVLLAVANIALTSLVLGCGDSVPQRSAEGGILSGTDVERNRYASRKNPLLGGNGPEEVGQQSSASQSPLLNPPQPTPRSTTAPTGPAASPAGPAAGTGTVGSPAGTGADPGATASPESATSGTPRAGTTPTPAPTPTPTPKE